MKFAPHYRRSSRKTLTIDLGPLPFDEKRAFVEDVCAVLIESRFGPGRCEPFVLTPTHPGPPDNYEFLDAMPLGLLLPDSVWESGPEGSRHGAAGTQRAREGDRGDRSFLDTSSVRSPTTLARGSPGTR